MLKKRRFFYAFVIGWAFHYKWYTRFPNWINKKIQNTKNKYINRWMHKYNPDSVTYATTNLFDHNYISQELKLSRDNI